ncbi:MAG: hypothetical protein AAFQ43_13415 [Bacteroidota bacterium]
MSTPEKPLSSIRRDRTVNRAASHEEADAWDREQHASMTPDERRRVARVLKRRAYPPDAPDIRACHRGS